MNILQRWGEAVRKAQYAEKLTNRELATRMKVTEGRWCHIVNGKSNPTLITMVRISQALGYTLRIELEPAEEER